MVILSPLLQKRKLYSSAIKLIESPVPQSYICHAKMRLTGQRKCQISRKSCVLAPHGGLDKSHRLETVCCKVRASTYNLLKKLFGKITNLGEDMKLEKVQGQSGQVRTCLYGPTQQPGRSFGPRLVRRTHNFRKFGQLGQFGQA